MKRSKKIVYNFTPYIKVYKENFSNRYLKKKNFHKIILQDSAMVILKNKKNEILFLNEYRRGIKKKSLGFPGGHIEKNEKPLKCIKRELLEETGYVAKNWKLLFHYTRHGTYNCGRDFIFTANVKNMVKKRKLENIEKKWLKNRIIKKNLSQNKFKTVGIIASILFYFYDKKIY